MIGIKDFRKHKDLTSEQQEELEACLHKVAQEDHIPCAIALAIAESLGIPASEVGKTANKLNIRIKNCLLDCF